jgi:crotonobetainyl-CoA:carnitine CoA-transferase CaiB-like acyl-CoA transferase
MAAMGARVIKCEQLTIDGHGSSIDPVREYIDQSKLSIALDRGVPEGRRLLGDLIEHSDIFLTDESPLELSSLGFSYQQLHAKSRSLIMVSITPFGYNSFMAERKADAFLCQAMSGMMYMVGDPQRKPIPLGGDQGDYTGGIAGFSGAVLALLARNKTTFGQLVDISIVDVLSSLDWKSTTNYLNSGKIPMRSGTTSRWKLLRCMDGWVAFIYQPTQWSEVCELVGDERLRDPELLTQAKRNELHSEWWPIVVQWAKTRSKLMIYHEAQALGLPFGYMCTIEEIAESPQIKHREFLQNVDQPAGRSLLVPNVPFLGSLNFELRSAPRSGENTKEVLTQVLNLDSFDLRKLIDARVINEVDAL